MKITLLVVGPLGAIPKQFDNRLNKTGITAEIGHVQKTILLGTAGILKKGSRNLRLVVVLCVSSLIIIIIIIIIIKINNNNNRLILIPPAVNCKKQNG